MQFQTTEIERGLLDLKSGHIGSAEARATAALAFLRSGRDHDRVREAFAEVLAGLVAQARDNGPAAVHSYLTAQDLLKAAQGSRSPDLSFSLVELGRLFTHLGQYDEARRKLDQAIAIADSVGLPNSVRRADALTALAELQSARGEAEAELETLRRAHVLLTGRVSDADPASGFFGEALQHSAQDLLGNLAVRLTELARARPELADESFAAIQDAMESRTGNTLAETESRWASRDGRVAELIKSRQAISDAIRQADIMLIKDLASNQPSFAHEIRELRNQRNAKAGELARLDAAIKARSSPGSDLRRSRPVSVAELQRCLSDDEAIIVVLPTERKLLSWVVSKDASSVIISPVPATEVRTLVSMIRRSIDLAVERQARTALPEFDQDAAARLYDMSIGPVSAEIADRPHLYFFLGGALQKLPMQLAFDASRGRWLIEDHSAANVPSLATFWLARQEHHVSGAPKALLWVGNPDLSRFDRQFPDDTDAMRFVARSLAHLNSLPDARLELEVMRSLFNPALVSAKEQDQATKADFVDSRPELFRVIVFATHAVMAGESGIADPAIVLTPGDRSVYSGLLSASEVARLQLDADLVILSACNTAAPDGGPYAESFSGLVRAFMAAGARSLLVSEWAVPARSAPLITTRFMKAMADDPHGGKPEALRMAILPLLHSEDPELRHPGYWAPFVMFGE